MRIGMVTGCYKPVINGVTRMVSLYKTFLEREGHEVTIFTLGDPDPAGDEPGVIRSPALPLGDSGYYFTMAYSKEAQRLLNDMEIIHCHHLFMSVEMAHRYGRCPIVYTNHTRYDLYTGAYIPLPQPAADALMRQIWPEFTDYCDVVVTPSRSVRDVMRDFGVDRPIVVIENGVDVEPFWRPPRPLSKSDLKIPESAVLAVFVGRLATEKNVELLLDQFAVAQELAPELHLMVIGRGPQGQELEERVEEWGLTGCVHFTGAVPYEAIPNYLAAADFFTTASVTEVHPLTVVEAMAAGLPVAAVHSPGISDTVESGKTGLLTSQAEGGLAAAITALATNHELRRQMGEAAQQASERYDIRRTVARTLELYDELRRTRPDLRRENEHGRWYRSWQKRQALVEQLANLIWPGD